MKFGEVLYCCVSGCPYKAVGWIEHMVEKRFLQGYEFTGEFRTFCPWHGISGLGSEQERQMRRMFLPKE